MKALDEGKYEAAVQSFSKAIAADPKDYFAHFNLGLAYGLLNRDAEGIAEYRKTLELQPRLYEAELNAAILLMRQKDPVEALPLLEDAAAQKPKEFRPVYFLAEAQSQTGAPEKAAESYRTAHRARPQVRRRGTRTRPRPGASGQVSRTLRRISGRPLTSNPNTATASSSLPTCTSRTARPPRRLPFTGSFPAIRQPSSGLAS